MNPRSPLPPPPRGNPATTPEADHRERMAAGSARLAAAIEKLNREKRQ